ncbi:hypothetical protein WMY93_010924 [Mugilogobius chulae]|uniref:tRNA uridine 5-carboxymethylaminomethyl modification enzyme C-terminal subdomain domain-containing protein n=1 Tax=Mugilogobius chulae TaxID=88201 RepID=A0AAW0P925_9GOBI
MDCWGVLLLGTHKLHLIEAVCYMKKLASLRCASLKCAFLVCRHFSHKAIQHYDVIVVGGGHAGTEAAAAAARLGAETLLVTQKISTIGALSCNPSLGGVGKGHLVKEVDALDGLCGRAGDWAGIHFSILNRRKGPAVWGPRAQLDRQRYREFIQAELLNTPKLTLLEGAVEELLVTESNPQKPGHHRITGVKLANGISHISASSVVLTTGTFLSGSLFVGRTTTPGVELPEEQLPCYLTYTTPAVEQVVHDSLHHNCHIQQDTKGPRYCPSIESRVLRFPGRSHQVWLEPEGLSSDLVYPQGLSMTMPPDMQLRLIREIPALHRAQIHMPGYGVQYDFVCPTQLNSSLQVKSTQGLFLAGQINGTTGYEEAAAQGLWAGVNAARSALSKPLVTLSRTESYIGVLVDDLVSRGVSEPYRMFTSRAEFRTSLRPDNADLRLTLKGFEEVGCVSQHRYKVAVRAHNHLKEGLAALEGLSLSSHKWRHKLPNINMSENKSTVMTGIDILQYKFSQRLKIEAVYKPHCDEQKKEIERIQKEENMALSPDIDYLSLPVSLSQEVREILHKIRPTTLGAASRLQGVTPAAIVHLLNYVQPTGHKEKKNFKS